ncbi:MAG: alpha/beta fold hydrolase [Solirubrobacteraceae bacterium]
MPNFDGVQGSVHYRAWRSPRPRAAVVFLHGFGEHSGLYHRLAQALNARGTDLWALDEIGHGLSDGERGIVGSVDALEANARAFTEIVRRARPGLPIVLAGHSLGGVTTALAGARDAAPWSGFVLSGTPIEPPTWAQEQLAEGGEGLALLPEDLSSDPWYLDALTNDELAFTETEGSPLDALPAAWEELARTFAAVRAPVLFIHGVDDPVAPIEVSRRWARELADARLIEFPGARHDVLNETVHASVAAAIADWVLARAAAAGTTAASIS